MASSFPLRRGPEEFLLFRRVRDAGPSAMQFDERSALLHFLRTCLKDPILEHKLRLWILSDPRPFMALRDDESLIEHIARRIASGQMALAKVEASGEGTGFIRHESPAGGTSQKTTQKKETTPLEDEMARRAENAMEEAEEVVLEEEEESEAEKKTWIQIELVDPNGLPAANERFKITLPDGSIKWGRLDSDGRAKVERLQPGTCQVTFPDRDEEVWEVS